MKIYGAIKYGRPKLVLEFLAISGGSFGRVLVATDKGFVRMFMFLVMGDGNFVAWWKVRLLLPKLAGKRW